MIISLSNKFHLYAFRLLTSGEELLDAGHPRADDEPKHLQANLHYAVSVSSSYN